jgi:hypothetical protein
MAWLTGAIRAIGLRLVILTGALVLFLHGPLLSIGGLTPL